MRSRLLIPVALYTCLALAGSARAQDDDSYAPASQAHRPGRWSMQFQLVEDFQFRAFEGAGLAMTRNAGTNTAWRFGLSLNGDLLDGQRTTAVDSFAQDVRPIDRNQYSVGLDLLHLRRYQPARRVGLELGIGPSVDLARFRDETHVENAGSSATFENRFSSSRYGLAARLGVEVFLARALSVHAHYGAFAGYQQETSTQHSNISYVGGPTGESFSEVQRRTWLISNEGVGMGISVYL